MKNCITKKNDKNNIYLVKYTDSTSENYLMRDYKLLQDLIKKIIMNTEATEPETDEPPLIKTSIRRFYLDIKYIFDIIVNYRMMI